MLEIKNLSFGYNKNFKLFENLSFTVNPGEIVKISGHNGCGKTTLLNCINGFLKPNFGDMIFNGVNIENIPVYKRSRLGIKRYFGNREFYSMSVEDVLRLVYSKAETKMIISSFGYNFASDVSGTLSSGEKTLLYLIMSLKGAKLIILDEPFNNLDKNRVILIRDFIYKMKKANISVLITDHSNNISFDKEVKMEKIAYDSAKVNVDYDFLIKSVD